MPLDEPFGSQPGQVVAGLVAGVADAEQVGHLGTQAPVGESEGVQADVESAELGHVPLGAFALAVSERPTAADLPCLQHLHGQPAAAGAPAHHRPALRPRPDGGRSGGAGGLAEAARRAHTAVADANELSEIPYAMRHKLLWPEHDGSRPKNPILYVALNPEVDELALPGVETGVEKNDAERLRPPGDRQAGQAGVRGTRGLLPVPG